MGKVKLADNYRCLYDGDEFCFRALSDRQAWYQAYELANGDLVEMLEEIDEYGNTVRQLMEENYDF